MCLMGYNAAIRRKVLLTMAKTQLDEFVANDLEKQKGVSIPVLNK